MRQRLAGHARAARPVVIALAAATIYYVFLLSAGHLGGKWPRWSAFYDAQAEGFRNGHLYLPERPSPALMALAHPLDPANMRFWRWDHSYRDGHLYIYWGLVPAALLAAAKAVLRIGHVVGDEVLVFLFLMGRALGGTLLIHALARARATAPPAWAVNVAVAVFLVANPTPYVADRPAVYEASIMAGSCFITLGLFFALRAVESGRGRVAGAFLAAASAALGLAAGSRPSLLPAVALLIAFTMLTCWRAGARLTRAVALGGGPAALIMGAHFVANQLRFGSWSEFGIAFQMSTRPLATMRRGPANLFFYLFQSGAHSCRFPFLSAPWPRDAVTTPSWPPLLVEFRPTEPSIGMLIAVPFVWLLLAGGVHSLVAARRRARGATPAPAASPAARWAPIAMAIWLVAAALPVIVLVGISMRYQADFASPLLLAATLAGWRLLAAATSSRARVAAAGLYLALAAATIVAGVLLGFGGYFDLFGRHNPALWSSLHKALDLCAHR